MKKLPLHVPRFGRPHKHLIQCTSTNDIAREWAADPTNPAPSGALVTADFQTRGRGQRGHEWSAEAGQSALMSFVYRLPPDADTSQLGLLGALAVCHALPGSEPPPKIKWPNDILLDGKKVGGILVEVAGSVAILGIGINVSQREFADASAYAYPPTSLRLALDEPPTVEEVIAEVGSFLSHWEAERQRDPMAIVNACRSRLAKGTAVRQGAATAMLIGLSDTAAAVVCLPDGTFTEWTTVH